MNKQPRLSTSGFFRLAGLTIALAASNQALSYDVTIDDFQAQQPTYTQTGPGTSFAPAFNDAGIYGGWRHIGLTNGPSVPSGAKATTVVDPFGSDNPRSTWQVALPSGNTNGYGEIIWNGSSNETDLSLTPLNLSTLVHFTINYLYADHTTTFYLQVYSNTNNCAQAAIGTVNGAPGLTNVVVLPGQFVAGNTANACFAGSAPADLNSIKKIRVVFTGDVQALDTDLRGLIATFEQPPQVQCVDKTLDGQKALQLQLGAKPPYNLTVGFTVSNTGGRSSSITVQDMMPADMTPTGPVQCTTPGGFTFGGQTTPDFTWISSSLLKGGDTATCSFPATLSKINEGQTLTNLLQAGATGQPFGPNQCRATITRPGRPLIKIPTMGEWGMITFMSLLGLLGVFGVRRYMA